MKFPLFPAVLGSLLTLASCTPKAVVVEEPTPGPAADQQAAAPAPEPEPPAPEGDDLRLPDMLQLPGEGELRATNPSLPGGPAGGGVISRPPTDPPPRPKPATD